MEESLFRLKPTYVVIPVRDRHDVLTRCVASVIDDAEMVIIVDNNSNPPIAILEKKVVILDCHDDPPNISKLWNIGIDYARSNSQFRGVRDFNIAVINSDVICPEMWLHRMDDGLRRYNATLAYPDQHNSTRYPIKHVVAEPIDLTQRITGYAFMLRGETSVRVNEDLKWWYSDDDLDWRCRELQGSVLLPNTPVEHLYPNSSTNADPRLAAQTAKDRETFQRIWGTTPW